MGDQQLSVGEKVHLAPLDGIGSPDVVEYRRQVGERAVVIGPDRIQFMVAAERVSRIPAVGEEVGRLRAELATFRARVESVSTTLRALEASYRAGEGYNFERSEAYEHAADMLKEALTMGGEE